MVFLFLNSWNGRQPILSAFMGFVINYKVGHRYLFTFNTHANHVMLIFFFILIHTYFIRFSYKIIKYFLL